MNFEDAIAALDDLESPWVHRRDAAVALGDAARRALETLNNHRRDPDVDVQQNVERVLSDLNAPLPTPSPDTYSLEDLAKACEKTGSRNVSPHGNGYAVKVRVASRSQTVYLRPITRKDGEKLLRVFTYCGKPTEKVLRWALRGNVKLAHCAFALYKEEDEEWIVLTNNIEMPLATPETVKRAVKEIARLGDWLERKLSGLDEF